MSKICNVLVYDKCYGIKKAAKEVLERGYNFYLSKDLKEVKTQIRQRSV